MIGLDRYRRAHGFSLVELMVAMVVALILLAGILQVLLGNRESFSTQKAVAGLQENARLASFVIENVVAHAGFRVELDTPDKRLFENLGSSARGVSMPAGGFVYGKNGGPNDNDVLRIRFQAAGGVHDCQGREIGTDGASRQIQTADVDLYVNDNNTLLCADNSGDGNTVPQPLVENVERFDVSYGLDTDADESVDTYSQTLTASQALDVRSLRVQLLLRSEDNVLPAAVEQSYDFEPDGTPPFNTITQTDRHAREMVDQSIALRNYLP